MTSVLRKSVKCLIAMSVLVFASTFSVAAHDKTPAVIAEWETFWNTYDLSQMDSLFEKKDSITYFSSERTGLIKGYEALIKHHEGFGFVAGGADKDTKLWLDEIETSYVGDAAIVAAIWYFDVVRDGKKVTMKGPVTFVCAKMADGSYKMRHVHFANY